MALISRVGLVDGQIVYAEHPNRIIDAFSAVSNTDILIWGDFQVTGSSTFYGNVKLYGGNVYLTSSLYSVPLTNNTTGSEVLVRDSNTGLWGYRDIATFSGSGGSGTPGGPEYAIQFNSGSTLSGSNLFTWNYTNNVLGINGTQIRGYDQNTFLGSGSGEVNNGSANTGTGYKSLYVNTSGSGNVANGAFALSSNVTGNDNTSIGYLSLMNNTGHNNTALGSNAFRFNTTGTGSVAIGYNAGRYNNTSNVLFIANSDTITPLVYGDFSLQRFGINKPTGSLNATLDISGSVVISGSTGLTIRGQGPAFELADNISNNLLRLVGSTTNTYRVYMVGTNGFYALNFDQFNIKISGSLQVTGSSNFSGSVTLSSATGSSFTGSFTGSLFGTSSWAVSASWAPSDGSSKWTGSTDISRLGNVSITESLSVLTPFIRTNISGNQHIINGLSTLSEPIFNIGNGFGHLGTGSLNPFTLISTRLTSTVGSSSLITFRSLNPLQSNTVGERITLNILNGNSLTSDFNGKVINLKLGTRLDNGTEGFTPQSGSQGQYTSILINPLINQLTGSSGSIIGIDYDPLALSISGSHYAALFRTGSVGIGTFSPSASLDVVGDTSTNIGDIFRLSNKSNTSRVIITNGGQLTFNAGGAPASQNGFTLEARSTFYVTATGSSSSNTITFINFQGHTYQGTVTAGQTGYKLLRLSSSFNPGGGFEGVYKGVVLEWTINQTTGSASVVGFDYNPIGVVTTGSHYAALFRTGSVGIGTPTPLASLHATGSVLIGNPSSLTPNTKLEVVGDGVGTNIAFKTSDASLNTHFTIIDSGHISSSVASSTIANPALYIVSSPNNNGNIKIGKEANSATNTIQLRNTIWGVDAVSTSGRDTFYSASYPFSFNTATAGVVAFHQTTLAGNNFPSTHTIYVGEGTTTNFRGGLLINTLARMNGTYISGSGIFISSSVSADSLNPITGSIYSGIDIFNNIVTSNHQNGLSYIGVRIRPIYTLTGAPTGSYVGIDYNPSVQINGAPHIAALFRTGSIFIVQTPVNDNNITQLLVRSSSGELVYREVASLSGSFWAVGGNNNFGGSTTQSLGSLTNDAVSVITNNTQRMRFGPGQRIRIFDESDGIVMTSGSGGARSLAFSGVSTWGTGSQYNFSHGSNSNTSVGEVIGFIMGGGTFNPGSGGTNFIALRINTGISQSSSASGSITFFNISSSIGGVSNLSSLIGIDYNPGITSLSGSHYAALFRTGSVIIGGSTATYALSPGAYLLDIKGSINVGNGGSSPSIVISGPSSNGQSAVMFQTTGSGGIPRFRILHTTVSTFDNFVIQSGDGVGSYINSSVFQMTRVSGSVAIGVPISDPGTLITKLQVRGRSTGSTQLFLLEDSASIQRVLTLDDGKTMIGIGIPGAKLEVKGDDNGASETFRVGNSSDEPSITILNNQKIGLNKDLPTASFHIKGVNDNTSEIPSTIFSSSYGGPLTIEDSNGNPLIKLSNSGSIWITGSRARVAIGNVSTWAKTNEPGTSDTGLWISGSLPGLVLQSGTSKLTFFGTIGGGGQVGTYWGFRSNVTSVNSNFIDVFGIGVGGRLNQYVSESISAGGSSLTQSMFTMAGKVVFNGGNGIALQGLDLIPTHSYATMASSASITIRNININPHYQNLSSSNASSSFIEIIGIDYNPIFTQSFASPQSSSHYAAWFRLGKVSGSSFIGQFTGSFSGSLSGSISSSDTASFAYTASYLLGSVTSASYALTASFLQGSVISASFASTASFVALAQSSSFSEQARSSSFSELSRSSSFSEQARSASFAINSFASRGSGSFTGSFSGSINSSSFAEFSRSGSFSELARTSSFTLTASFLQGSVISASYALTASSLQGAVTSASFASTASFVALAQSASFASTSSYINILRQNVIITGSLFISGSSSYFTNNRVHITSSAQSSSLVVDNISSSLYIEANKNGIYLRSYDAFAESSAKHISGSGDIILMAAVGSPSGSFRKGGGISLIGGDGGENYPGGDITLTGGGGNNARNGNIFLNSPLVVVGANNTGSGVGPASNVMLMNVGTMATASSQGAVIMQAVTSSDGAATLSMFTSQSVEAIGTFTASHKLKILINGVEYYIQLDQV